MTYTSQKMEETSIVKWLQQCPVLWNLQGKILREPFLWQLIPRAIIHILFDPKIPLLGKFPKERIQQKEKLNAQ